MKVNKWALDIKGCLCDAEVIEQSVDAVKEFWPDYGDDPIILNEYHIKALKKGKMLHISDGECVHFVVFESSPKNEIHKGENYEN